jgi:hypothetical protein
MAKLDSKKYIFYKETSLEGLTPKHIKCNLVVPSDADGKNCKFNNRIVISHLPKALVTPDIFTHNIAIKRFFDQNYWVTDE